MKSKTTSRTILALVLFLACIAFLFAFAPVKPQNNRINIISTVFPGYDFARAITQDEAEITLLVPPGTDIHSYEPSPQDIINIQNCDLFIYVGGESESWIDTIVANINHSKTHVVRMMDAVELVEEEIIEGMEVEHAEEKEYDEHVWTSPINAIKIAQTINVALQDISPNSKSSYQANTEKYIKSLEQLDQDFHNVISNAKRHEIIFGDRFPFRYFADEYNLKYYAAFPGCSEQTEASAATITFLVNKIKNDHIPYIFATELSNQAIAKTIAAETQAGILELHSLHNVSKTDFESGKTYLEIMYRNLDNLQKALNE